ncbi:hypothetical protein JCM8115_000731 [Rhodotorula mucilaginosa]|uniref:Uncharacterized protein n=1 Tax=Rhodotorula mucilaginosa TaxID=5537 RepID=A0A9P6W0J7_RHOMI|nr:hypothetical protein C6P46_004543 [Rhodotorula mucilaginosa]TKA56967.1 hypothetical protein B0A53_01368 [Rhodotorula sp. CCFEE 5036]
MAKKTAARRSSAGGDAPVKLASPITTSTTSAKPLPISQASDNESDAEEDGDLSDEDEDEDDEQGDESEDVTPEALERMMQLLGDDVDAAELGLLSGMTAEDDDDDDDDEDDEDDEDEEDEEEDDSEDDDDDVLEEGDSEMIPYEAIQDADQEDLVPVEKTTVNDKVALERVLASFKTDAGFFDTLTLTNPKPLNVPDANNDLERELEFYKQSLWAAMHAESLFEKASLPFHRPTDYFAEMVKTDAHMAQIRQSLLDEQAGMKASEDARKLRDAKKFGKKVQHERLRERERDKKAIGEKLDSLKKKRKGDSSFGNEDFEVALEDALASGASSNANKKRKPNESERPGRAKRGLSRDSRDKKYGFGGGKDGGRRGKQNNDREDGERGSGAFGGGGGGRGGGRGGRGGGGRGGGRGGGARGGAAKRPGKSRRH